MQNEGGQCIGGVCGTNAFGLSKRGNSRYNLLTDHGEIIDGGNRMSWIHEQSEHKKEKRPVFCIGPSQGHQDGRNYEDKIQDQMEYVKTNGVDQGSG
jgi:hypothetical protein